MIEAGFANNSARGSVTFVPLAVLQTPDGKELSETYGAPLTLSAGQATTVRLLIKGGGVAPGRYFLALIPSDPVGGKPVGAARYRIPVVIGD